MGYFLMSVFRHACLSFGRYCLVCFVMSLVRSFVRYVFNYVFVLSVCRYVCSSLFSCSLPSLVCRYFVGCVVMSVVRPVGLYVCRSFFLSLCMHVGRSFVI